MGADSTRAPDGATAFTIHEAAWRATVATYEAHCAAHRPANTDDRDLWIAYESSYSALVSAMFDAGVAAVQARAANADEVARKIAIIEAQEYWGSSEQTSEALIRALAADAIRFAGGAA